MTVRAAQRRLEEWAESRVSRRRQYTLMSISTTIVCVAAILLASGAQEISEVDRIFADTAQIFGCALVLALAVEAGGGIRNLLRADILMLVALYGIIFLEFLFQQDSFAGRVSLSGAQTGTTAALIGFAGIAVGRHLPLRFGSSLLRAPMRDLSSDQMIRLFVSVAAAGYLHMLLAVNFDIFELLRQMAMPRFSQAWSRGRLGGVNTLLHEVGLLIYLIPPFAGTVFAQARRYGGTALAVVAAILAFTLYKGFAGGTRSEFIIYIITFVVAYLLARPRLTAYELLVTVAPAVVFAMLATVYMLEFRRLGLAYYDFGEPEQLTVMVDLNLITISRLSEVFPAFHDFLGWEIPLQILIRPIPRALWPGKPEGLSIGIEDALGAQGMTLSAAFVGESYMAGGLLAVAVAALILGSLAATWNRVGARLDSRFMLIFYASGFFAAALAMRSVLQVAPAVLPSLTLWLYGRYSLTVKRRPGGSRLQ